MSTGKQYEREIVSELRDVGLTAERVPRSVADAMPGVIDDVVVVPEGWQTADHDHRPITYRLKEIDDLDARMEAMRQVKKLECKYRADGGFGMSTLRKRHLRTVGLGTARPICWTGHEPAIYTGGPAAFAVALEYGAGAAECWEVDETLPASTVGLLEEAHGAALRESGEPWVLVWEAM